MVNTIYSHSRWGEIQQEKEGGIAHSILIEHVDGIIEYQFISRRAGVIDGVEYFDMVTPRGEGGIFLKNGTLSQSLIDEFEKRVGEYCQSDNIVAELVRFDPWNQLHTVLDGIYNLRSHGCEYCVDVNDKDFFMTQYSSKRRNQVRKALSSDIFVDTDAGIDAVDTLIKLYEYTDSKYNVSNYYKLTKEFLLRYFEVLGEKVSMCVVSYKDEPISAGMFLNGGDVYHYHFSANNPKYAKLNASSAMLYEECKLANKLGCKWLDLGSATPGSGLESFKKSMISEKGLFECFMGTKIRNQIVYDRLMEQNGIMPEYFFPRYKRN